LRSFSTKSFLALDETKSLLYNKNKLNNALKRGEIVGIGRKIAEVRKQKGLSQEHIATKMNKTPQWLSNIERETRSISADKLAQVANILGVSPSIFFNKETNETSKTRKTGTE
jgi:ribosome-binding protein aMBF1 (putative translation factor)